MAPQILQWKTADCVEFLRKCAKRYAAIISESELDSFVMNFEKNHVAGSTILTFSNEDWNALIPSLGFRNFVRQELEAKEKLCEQERRTALWNSSRQRSSEEQSKPTLKDMPSKLTIDSFFARKETKPVITEGTEITEQANTTETGLSSPVLSPSEKILTASNVETFIAQLGKYKDSHSTLLFRRACLELYALLQKNKSDTARKMIRLCPNSLSNEESCRKLLSGWEKQQALYADINFEEQLRYYVTNGVLMCIGNTGKQNALAASSRRASSIRPGPRPQWEPLELQLVDHIRNCHAQRIAVSRVTVIHKALELDPTFLGGIISDNFVRRSTRYVQLFSL